MALLSKLLVFASLAGALVFEAYQSRALYPYLPALTAAAAIAGVAGGRLAPRRTTAAILLVAYWFPLLFVAAAERRFLPPFFAIWNAALAGVVVSDRGALAWSFPRRWQFPLVLWALTVALAWPLIAMREGDFESFSLLERYRVSNSSLGGSPTMTVGWMADVAAVHLLGLLWFDALFRRAAAMDRASVERWIAAPLAIGAVAGAALALYQGVVDIGFLSGGVWPSMSRAAGPLLDANAFGIIAALWSAALLGFAATGRAQALSTGGAVLCWLGLWMTGSRTALLAAIVALVPVAIVAVRWARTRRTRRRDFAIGAAAVALVSVLVLTGSVPGPLQRLRRMPTFAGDEGADWLVRELWDRSSYGSASAALTASHPVVGVGLGMFQPMGADYIRRTLHDIVPDNAQNWWRHQIAELGFLGSAGLILWTGVFLGYLVKSPPHRPSTLHEAALKGALIGIAMASLVGMPAQGIPVSMTFWTLAYWLTRLTDGDLSPAPGGLRPIGWTALVCVLSVFLVSTFIEARGSLRPPMRAAAGGWPYTYGMYPPPVPLKDDPNGLWTERHGVTVVPVGGRSMILAVRAEHPDLGEKPVRAIVNVDGRKIVDTKLSANAPLVRTIEMPEARLVVIEARVDRTWRAGTGTASERDAGLALSWRFADRE